MTALPWPEAVTAELRARHLDCQDCRDAGRACAKHGKRCERHDTPIDADDGDAIQDSRGCWWCGKCRIEQDEDEAAHETLDLLFTDLYEDLKP